MSGLIKNVLLPEKIGNYYLFSKRVVGVDIGRASIKITKTLIQGETATIEMILEEKLDSGMEETDNERITRTISNLFAKIGRYDEIATTLPSSVVVFKELSLPFITHDQIRMVINFEIEPLLPFPLHDAIIDFVITHQDIKDKQSEILVTAVQKKHIIEHLTLFESAGLTVTTINVDMIALYALYQQLSFEDSDGTALIDIGLNTTDVALIRDSQLKTVRTISQGITTLAKLIAQKTNNSPQKAMEQLLRFGLEKEDDSIYTQAAHTATESLWKEINFTLVSFAARMLNRQKIKQLLFLGDGELVHNLVPALTKKSDAIIHTITTEAITKNKKINVKNGVSITSSTIISISSSLPSQLTDEYNLRQQEFKNPQYNLLFKQLIVYAVMICGLFGTLIFHYMTQTKKLKREIEQSRKEAISAIEEAFPDLKGQKKLSAAIDNAKAEIVREQKTWFAYSNKSRALFLQTLLELTSRIHNAKNIDFTLEQLTISDGILTLKARVKDHPQLISLENELNKSELFSYIEPQENPQFTMKIILATTTTGEL